MNSELGRRTFIRSAAGTGIAAAGTAWTAETASAEPGGPARTAGPGAHESALRDARMVWDQAPRERSGAPFLGDNSLAVQVFLRPDGTGLRFSLGPTGPGWDSSPAFLDLVPDGAITAVRLELDLWNAELTGTIATARGTVAISALVVRGHSALLVSSTAQGGEPAVSFTAGPEGDTGTGVAHAVQQSGSRTTVTATAGHGDARRTLQADQAALSSRHRTWWHRFYRRSYLSVPDRTVQRFHWIQLYTAGCLLSPQAPAPHSSPTFLNRSGHTDLSGVAAVLGDSAWTPGTAHRTWAFPGAGTKAGPSQNLLLAWGAPQIWDAYRHTDDAAVLSEQLHPLLRTAVGFYSRFLVQGADGRLHLPTTHSPGCGDVVDSTHDLSLLRWATTALIGSTRTLGLTESQLSRWQDIAARLVPYHQDTDGVSIGAGVRLARSHAGAGHLLWLSPLYDKRWNRPEDRTLMTRSFDHWAGMRQSWDARSYARGASMAATVRQGGNALALLHHLMDGRPADATRLLSNTACHNGRQTDLTVPFAAGQAVLDLLLGGEPDIVDVFPAVPETWADATVFGLRAPGAFTVDAARTGGRTDWVRVHSRTSRTLTLRHGIGTDVDVRLDSHGTTRPAHPREAGPGTCVLKLDAGQSVVVARRGAAPDVEAHEVPAEGGGRRWGGTA